MNYGSSETVWLRLRTTHTLAGWAFLVGWTGILLSGSQVLESNSISAFMCFAGMIAVLLLVIFSKVSRVGCDRCVQGVLAVLSLSNI